MKILLLAGGDIADYSIALEAAHSSDMIICADSGIRHAERIGAVPDIWVGDLDSSDTAEHRFGELIRLPVEKDDTDTMSAARIIVENGADSAVLLGCTGTRLDHTYANLFVLKYLLDNGVSAYIEDDHNRIFLLENGSIEIPKEEGRFLSLLPFCCDAEGVGISGVKYPLCNAALRPDHPLGVSNEITDIAKLSVKNGCLAVFLSRD